MYPEVELLDPVVVLCLISEESPYHYSQWVQHLVFPPAMHKGSSFSTSAPTLVIFCVSYSFMLCVFNYIIIFGHITCGILVPQPEIEPETPALEAQSLNHWTTREVQFSVFVFVFVFFYNCHLTGHDMVIQVTLPAFCYPPSTNQGLCLALIREFLKSGW